MASSRASTPSDNESVPSALPTPRTKIRQLLADVSSSSDEGTSPTKKTARKSPSASRESRPAATETTAASSHSSDGSDDEDDIVRPRGKFAARMMAQSKPRQDAAKNSEKDAPERVAGPLQHGPADDQPGHDNASDVHMADEQDDGEDETVKARPRKLKQRRQRSLTPVLQARQPDASPGLFVSPDRAASPGLFVTPSKVQPADAQEAATDSESDPDLPKNPLKNARFLALVEKKRKEREAREAEEARKKEARLAAQQAAADDAESDDEDSGITDDEGGHRLTQSARPKRMASKKAMEEMNRETQRLTRSLQLAHEPKTKKKMTKADLFERFNFKPAGVDAGLPPATAKLSSSQPSTPVSAGHTDAEMKDAETPPSSPPALAKDVNIADPVHAPHTEPATALDSHMTLDSREGPSPTLDTALEAAANKKRAEKGKGIATAADLQEQDEQERQQREPQTMEASKGKREVRVKLPPVQANLVSLDSDDDLEIVTTKKTSIDAIFDRVPLVKTKEPRSMQALRHLAQLDDPDKRPAASSRVKNAKPAMTVGELQLSLQQRARQQAKLERERQMESLRAKGIHVQTAEEREREMNEVEDIITRARNEAEEIMEREREAAKKDRKARRDAGEIDPLAWDDSDDDSYVEEGQEPEVVELSGSEGDNEDADMESGDEDNDDEEEKSNTAGGLFDDAAESTGESGDELQDKDTAEPGDLDSDEEDVAPKKLSRASRKHVTVLSDDEDEEPRVEATPRPKAVFPKSPSAPGSDSPSVPTSVLRSATKSFIPGLPVAGVAAGGLGLTQIFAGTMGDSQTGNDNEMPSQPMPSFEHEFPDSNFSQTAREPADDMILDSQPGRTETQNPETQGIQLNFEQSQVHGFESLLQDEFASTPFSDRIEPSQDQGFQERTPLLHRFVSVPPSTVETVPIGNSQAEAGEGYNDSPLVKRTGRLRRRADVVAAPTPALASISEDEDEAEMMDLDVEGAEEAELDEFGFGTVLTKKTTTAFSLMKEAAVADKKRKAAEAFNKKKSKAREMVEEQAEESEDEYAGLGGADGEGSDDDDDASVKDMIDDQTKNTELDERTIAAFYADRERASDEKQVDKLFRDITSGQLRRKRAGSFGSLSDDDDGGEAHRRMKRRQFQKMQQALFADERISKVAENPRNQAFLRTIEDHGSDDDMDFLFVVPPTRRSGQEETSSQDTVAPQSGAVADESPRIIPDSQPAERSSSHRRSGKMDRRPANLAEIRESLSDLLDGPGIHGSFSSVIPATELGSDGEGDDNQVATRGPASSPNASNKENQNPRRSRPAVVDRISLKRNSSSNLSATGNNPSGGSIGTAAGAGRLAFAAPSAGAGGAFRVPALLRRATTNSLLSSSSSSGSNVSSTGTTTANHKDHSARSEESQAAGGGFGAEAKVRRPGAGKRSGVNFVARESERRAVVAQSEARREARKFKGAEGRSKVVGGLFGAGKFA